MKAVQLANQVLMVLQDKRVPQVCKDRQGRWANQAQKGGRASKVNRVSPDDLVTRDR